MGRKKTIPSEEVRNLLLGVLHTLDNVGCTFWACEGPDVPYVPMGTCSVCQCIKDIRDFMEEYQIE